MTDASGPVVHPGRARPPPPIFGAAPPAPRRRGRSADDGDGSSSLSSSAADHRPGGWLRFVNKVDRMCKSASSGCSTRSTDSMTTATAEGDAATGGGGDSMFESLKSPPGGGSTTGGSTTGVGASSSGTTTATSSSSSSSSRVSPREEAKFWSAVGGMRGVRETAPLGGPKYYVVSITDMGISRIVHEAMPPPTGVGGEVRAATVADERGFEVIEYDLLLAEETGEGEGGRCSALCGAGEFLDPDPSEGDDVTVPRGSPTGTEVAGPPATADLENIDWPWVGGQEDVVSVISDCTHVSVESGITMDSSLTDGSTEDGTKVWNDGENTGEHSMSACCHPVVFD
jgi:hypothetical protein